MTIGELIIKMPLKKEILQKKNFKMKSKKFLKELSIKYILIVLKKK